MNTWNTLRREAEMKRFYCRRDNLLVGGCPLSGGPCRCPLSPECPAREITRRSGSPCEAGSV